MSSEGPGSVSRLLNSVRGSDDCVVVNACSTVDLAVDIIERIHRFLGGEGNRTQWVPPRGTDGRFEVEKLR